MDSPKFWSSPPRRLEKLSCCAYFRTFRIASAITPTAGPRSVGRGVSGGRSGAGGPVENAGGGSAAGVGCGGAVGGVASSRSGELPRENGIGLVGRSARSTVRARRSRSDKSARGDTFGAGTSSFGWTNTNRARSRSRSFWRSSSARSCSSIAFCRCSMISRTNGRRGPSRIAISTNA